MKLREGRRFLSKTERRATGTPAPGRDFRLNLALRRGGRLRIEVTDTRGERMPPGPATVTVPDEDAESGRGPLVVDALAHRWGVALGPVPRKTVGAELDPVP